MKNIKKSLVVIVLLTIGMFTLTGCESSEQRITQLENLIATTQQASASFDAQILQIKTSLPQLQAALADANVPPELYKQAADAFASAQAKLKQFEDAKVKADTAISNWKNTIAQIKADANSLTWADEVAVVGEGAKQIGPMLPPPIGTYVTLGGWLLAIIGGAFAKKKSIEAQAAQDAKDEVQAKYQAHKQGVELTMKECSISPVAAVKAIETQLYNNIGEARQALGVS